MVDFRHLIRLFLPLSFALIITTACQNSSNDIGQFHKSCQHDSDCRDGKCNSESGFCEPWSNSQPTTNANNIGNNIDSNHTTNAQTPPPPTESSANPDHNSPDKNHITPPDEPPPGDPDNDRECDRDSECLEWQFCELTDGLCVDRYPPCEHHSECGGNQSCVDGLCMSRCDDQLSCNTNEVCNVLDDSQLCVPLCEGLIPSPDSPGCPGNYQCYPDTPTTGTCKPAGQAERGEDCMLDGQISCTGGLRCVEAGEEALAGNATHGICMAYCNPEEDSSGACLANEFCQTINDHESLGICRQNCDPSLNAADNNCPSQLPRCIPQEISTQSSAISGMCVPSGTIAMGEPCDRTNIYECNPDAICVGTGSTGTAGTCEIYCQAFNYTPSANSRCLQFFEACATVSFEQHIGYCTMDITSTGFLENDSCADSNTNNLGRWCNDDLLCLRWDNENLTCRIPCMMDSPGTCPDGTQCEPGGIASAPQFGSCQ